MRAVLAAASILVLVGTAHAAETAKHPESHTTLNVIKLADTPPVVVHG